MRHTISRVLLLACIFTVMSVQSAHASPELTMKLTDDSFNYLPETVVSKQTKISPIVAESEKEKEPEPAPAPQAPIPIEHTVLPGETLSKIAIIHQTKWNRIFFKNTQISDPDIISVGAKLTIPAADEQLVERALPQPVVTPPEAVTRTQTAVAPPQTNTQVAPARAANSPGNTYAAGYCTWYAKSRRPDLPNRLGNASSWVSRSAALGYATGTAPQAGAIGQQGNHVVYVESVNSDGTVTVSEMNYRGLYVVSSRTASAASFRYIY